MTYRTNRDINNNLFKEFTLPLTYEKIVMLLNKKKFWKNKVFI